MFPKILTFWFITIILNSIITQCEGCSCQFLHPQEHFCNSDFVVLARIKKQHILHPQSDYGLESSSIVYKVRVRKHFKITEKGLAALKSGKLHAPLHETMCGVHLDIGKLYVISGRILSLQAHISLCNMAMEWQHVTRRQRKGLKMLYKKGCECKVKTCIFGNKCPGFNDKNTCPYRSPCESENGICLRQLNGKCMWNKNKQLNSCLRGIPYLNNTSSSERNLSRFNFIRH